MKSFVVLALAATALSQQAPPAGCQSSVPYTFNIQTITTKTKRSLDTRQTTTLGLTLQNGNLKDQNGRIGYIAANYQFQFDNPVQAGAISIGGFSVCSNGSLALSNGRSAPALFYQCLSGGFYNLYDRSTGAQCVPINIQAVNQNMGSASASRPASQLPDGQPQVTSPASRPVSQITDGQPQAASPAPRPVSQITDGQPQAASPAPRPVSQITDGQPQAASPAPRPASSAPRPVSQITDGQPQAASPAPRPVSQITDGQPQAASPAPRPASSVPRPVSQITDGQPQAASPAPRPVVSQISDGQPQAPAPSNGTVVRPSPSQFTGAAATGNVAVGAFAAGVAGLLAFL